MEAFMNGKSPALQITGFLENDRGVPILASIEYHSNSDTFVACYFPENLQKSYTIRVRSPEALVKLAKEWFLLHWPDCDTIRFNLSYPSDIRASFLDGGYCEKDRELSPSAEDCLPQFTENFSRFVKILCQCKFLENQKAPPEDDALRLVLTLDHGPSYLHYYPSGDPKHITSVLYDPTVGEFVVYQGDDAFFLHSQEAASFFLEESFLNELSRKTIEVAVRTASRGVLYRKIEETRLQFVGGTMTAECWKKQLAVRANFTSTLSSYLDIIRHCQLEPNSM
jgi:hypothetical protein